MNLGTSEYSNSTSEDSNFPTKIRRNSAEKKLLRTTTRRQHSGNDCRAPIKELIARLKHNKMLEGRGDCVCAVSMMMVVTHPEYCSTFGNLTP